METSKKSVTLIFSLVVCSLILIEGNVIKDVVDDAIYGAIGVSLKDSNPGEDEKVRCMVDDFRRNRVADNFYTSDLLLNPDKLRRKIQPYVDVANIKCTIIVFFQSPLGILTLVLLISLAIGCIFRQICRICC